MIVSWLVALALLYSAAMLFTAYLSGENLGEWVWQRHQNLFSWYSRPLFVVPACYYAYRRKPALIFGFMALLGCSLFWFAAPDNVPEHVVSFLDWEKELFFSNDSVFPLLLLVLVVTVFLVLLFYAFWQRSLWVGLLIINVGTVVKVIVSLVFGQQAGAAAVVPSLSSLAIINTVALMIWRWRK